MSEKPTGNSKKYNVVMQSTNGTIISASGPGANITITNRTTIGSIEHYYCGPCSRHIPIEEYRTHQCQGKA